MEALSGIIIFTVWVLFLFGGYRLFRYINKLGREGGHAPYVCYYSVPLPPTGIYDRLCAPIRFGEWTSQFDPEQKILVFSHYSGFGNQRFELQITDMGHFSVVSLGILNMRTKGLSVNTDAFMEKVFGATVIPNENMHPNESKTEEAL